MSDLTFTVSTPHTMRGNMRTREQVFELVGQGKTNQEIAKLIGKSESTVKHHITNLFAEHSVGNRIQLALKSAEQKSTRIIQDPDTTQIKCPLVENLKEGGKQ